MNPFEVSRTSAGDTRSVLAKLGVSSTATGPELIVAACTRWGLVVKRVRAGHPLLGGADATIKIEQRWIVVRQGLDPDLEAFLVAHELGHFFLHNDANSEFGVSVNVLAPDTDGTPAVRYVEAYGPRERQELQANVFAREFLLPRTEARNWFLSRGLAASAIAAKLCVPIELVRLQLFDALLLPSGKETETPSIPKSPTPAQEPAVNSPHRHTLVEAGPGTGKTTTLLLRLRMLLERGVDPSGIVVLTFSNKAARELVDRLKNAAIPNSERVWVGTFHSFGLEFLRKFGTFLGLPTEVKVLDPLAALTMLEEVLPRIPLHHFDPLSDPIGWLPDVLKSIARCKDELIDAHDFSIEVANHIASDSDIQAKRIDAASLYRAYEQELAERRVVDLKDLLLKTIQLLDSSELSIEEYRRNIKHVLVDEYQDVNRASAQLVIRLSKNAETLWAVGDAHQAIYAFMGASSLNISGFAEDFPGAKVIPLGMNHRSSQEIADAFHKLSTRNPSAVPALRLDTTKGRSGLEPSLVECADEQDEIATLATEVLHLRSNVPLSQQAVIVFTHARATAVAQGLEKCQIPVLYLGNLYERPEIKDLLCLLHLSINEDGAALGRDWWFKSLSLPHDDLAKLFETRTDRQPWWQCDRSALSEASRRTLQQLDELTQPLRDVVSPWDALSILLLEDGRLLRMMCADDTLAAVNVKLAVWQFAHSCRSPDGLTQYPTVRNLFDRIRRRLRLGQAGQDPSLRQLPPEADAIDAVRITTAHSSKGLEFDAIHLLEVERKIYEPSNEHDWPLIPEEILCKANGLDEHAVSKIERHNLLYVGLSRARQHLIVYKQHDAELPSALDGICSPRGVSADRIVVPAAVPNSAPVYITNSVSLTDLAQFKNTCPRRVEFSRRVGQGPRGSLPVYRLMDVALGKVLKRIAAKPTIQGRDEISGLVKEELQRVQLEDHGLRHKIEERTTSMAETASRFFAEGGAAGGTVSMRVGPLSVQFEANQVIVDRGSTIRIMRARESQIERLRQPLGAMIKTHEEATGEKLKVEGVVLETGKVLLPTNVKTKTIEMYKSAADDLSKGRLAARPSPFHCPKCAYFMLCHQGRT